MNLKEVLKTMSPEEIEDHLVSMVLAAEKDSDRLKALELLAKVKGLIKHGNLEKKDYREVIVGSEGETKAGESSDDK